MAQNESLAVDAMLGNWQAQIISIFDEMAPVKQYPWRRKRLPWLADDIFDLMERRDGVMGELKNQGWDSKPKMTLLTTSSYYGERLRAEYVVQ